MKIPTQRASVSFEGRTEPDDPARIIAESSSLFWSSSYRRSFSDRAVSPVWVCLSLIAAAMKQREWAHEIWDVAHRIRGGADGLLLHRTMTLKAEQPRLYADLVMASFPDMVDPSLSESLAFLTTASGVDVIPVSSFPAPALNGADLRMICSSHVADYQCRTTLRLLCPFLLAHAEMSDAVETDEIEIAVNELEVSLVANVDLVSEIIRRHSPQILVDLTEALTEADRSIATNLEANL